MASLATFLGVSEDDQPLFFTMVQERYASLVPSEDASPVVVLRAIQEAMADHPVLAKLEMVK